MTQGPAHLRTLPPPPGPPLPLLLAGGTGTLGVYGPEVFLILFLLQLQVPGGHQGRAKALWGAGGVGGDREWVNQVFILTGPTPTSTPPGPPPSAPCPGPHRRPGGEDAVEHVTSESHADHQISGIAGGRATGEGAENLTPWSHTQRSPRTYAQTPRGQGHIPSEPPPEESQVPTHESPQQAGLGHSTNTGPGRNPLPTGRARSPLLHIPDPHPVSWLVLRQP